MPHPEKVDKGGEDALFANEKVLSVADGVGGWTQQGIDPAIYSRKLCTNVETFSNQEWREVKKDPKQLIKFAWENNQEDGSSTLVVATLPEDGNKIFTSYIGDSSYMIMRPSSTNNQKSELLFKSEPQQKGFNFPYQLGWGQNGDHPKMSISFAHTVETGDIVILGSDGVFDNLEAEEVRDIVDLVLFQESNEFDAQIIAESVASAVYDVSLDTKRTSPFGREAKRYGYMYKGGKSDDIAVVVGQVQLAESNSSASTDL